MNKEQNSVILAQANALTQARYDFNVIEKRCLYQIIKEVRRLYVDTGEAEEGVFNTMHLQLTPDMLEGLADKKKQVYESLSKLRKRDVEIDTEDYWIGTGYISSARHNKKKDIYEIEVSRDIIPYLVALSSNFTTYDLTVAISLRSSYSQRFYEFCSQYKNRPNKTFFFTVDELRQMMILENKYQNINDFKRKVLDVAQKEIKELYDKGQCELWFDYAVKDTNKRKILSYFFYVHTRKNESTPTDYKTVEYCLARINSILTTFFKKDKKFIARVIQGIQLKPDMAIEICEKMEKKVLDFDKASIPPILRYILKEDFGLS